MTVEAGGIGMLSLISDLAEGILLLELSAQLAIRGDQLLASLNEGLARSDGAVRLDAQKDLGDVGMSNLVTSHQNMGGSLEMLGDEIAECMVLLQHDEVGRVAHSSEDLLCDLLLSILKEEELEPIGRVHVSRKVKRRGLWYSKMGVKDDIVGENVVVRATKELIQKCNE